MVQDIVQGPNPTAMKWSELRIHLHLPTNEPEAADDGGKTKHGPFLDSNKKTNPSMGRNRSRFLGEVFPRNNSYGKSSGALSCPPDFCRPRGTMPFGAIY